MRVVRFSPALCRIVAVLAAALVAGPIVYHLLRGSNAYLGLLEDDHFYYSIVVDNFVRLGQLTYDRSTLTNGFHPLWFAVLLVLRVIAGGLNGAFYGMLAAVLFVSMIATYELSRAFSRALGASAALAPAVALIHCVATDTVLASGMETAVDVPLLLWLLLELCRATPVTPRRAAKLGFVASLAILARLDIALVVPLALVGWFAFSRPRFSQVWRAALAFCAAGVGVPVYAAFNLWVFGGVLPMSALAKQLVKQRGVNIHYLSAIVFGATQYGRTAGVTLALGLVAAYVLWRRRAGERSVPRAEALADVPRPEALFVGALAIVFAGLFFVANTLSGWMYFGWYSYPLGPALVASITFVGMACETHVAAAFRARSAALLVAAAALVASVQAVKYFVTHGPLWSVGDNGLLAMSIELADRMRGREGIYGMGAIGGFASFEMQRPVVQLEGLVSDRAMIEHIRHEDELGSVLRSYHVDYLVVSVHDTRMVKRDGCYALTQPDAEWAGKRVAKMHGEICEEPIVSFSTRAPQHPWSAFSSLDTYVFDVRGDNAKWRTSNL